ncbi:MAG: DUF1906 domain-containing protein [Clostridia bacterium]|nr:DUF1906 domain-containing protein [Clostridia bacterium]
MACKGAKHAEASRAAAVQSKIKTAEEAVFVGRLLFGVDSKIQANDILQNNISMFEWVVRNKIYPNFWGRNLVGENALTKQEIDFIHSKACKIAAVYNDLGEKQSEEQGKSAGEIAVALAFDLEIPQGSALFLDIGEESASKDYLKGFAEELIESGYTPAFKTNTDAKFNFDREFSRGLQSDREVFEQCLVWAVVPTLSEYDSMTTTHLIHPDNWVPYAPSGIKRKDIAVWQYGKDCYPIEDDKGVETAFNINLVRNEKVIIENMF